MRSYKKILLALVIAASTGTFSSASFAVAEHAKVNPATLIDTIAGEVNAANALIAAGGESRDDVLNLVKRAKDLTKEVSANDKVDFKRQRVQGEMKKAIVEIKAGNMEGAAATLKQVISTLNEMKSLIN
jgi:hypothetical protein